MAFQEFTDRGVVPQTEPIASIRADGTLSINRAVIDMLNGGAVVLLFDPETREVAMKGVPKDTVRHAYPLTIPTGATGALIRAASFAQRYGLLDHVGQSFRVRKVGPAEDNLIGFPLDEPTEVPGRGSVGRGSSPAQRAADAPRPGSRAARRADAVANAV